MKNSINKRMLSLILTALWVIGQSGLAGTTGILGRGSSYEAYAVGGVSWSNILKFMLTREEQEGLKEFISSKLGVDLYCASNILSRFDGALSLIANNHPYSAAVLTEENIAELRKCYNDFVRSKNFYTYVGDPRTNITLGLPESADLNMRYEGDQRAFVISFLSSFNSDGRLKKDENGVYDNGEWPVLVSNFIKQFNMSQVQILGDGEIFAFDAYNMVVGGYVVDLTPVFKFIYAIAKDMELNLGMNVEEASGGQ